MSVSNPIQPIKSIRPITPNATSMPAKSVAPMGSVAPQAPMSTLAGSRDSYWKNGLQPIGAEKRRGSNVSRDTYRSSRVADRVPYAFMALAGKSVTGGPKYNDSYVTSFKDYSSFFTGFSTDFGAGVRRLYHTAEGDRMLYEYEYHNLIRYGDTSGPKTTNDFAFRDGRWWTVSAARETYGKFSPSNLDESLRQYALSSDEDEALYQSALKNRLSSAQYEALYKSVFSKKFYSLTDEGASTYTTKKADYEKQLSAYFSVLETDKHNGEAGVSPTAHFGSIYGHGDPGIGFLNELSAMLPEMQKSLTNLYKQLKDGTTFSIIDVDSRLSKGLPLIGTVIGTIINIVKLAKLGFEPTGGGKALWLIGADGRLINSYSDIGSSNTRKVVAAVADNAGMSRDDMAATLGMLYRFRLMKKYQPLVAEYNAFGESVNNLIAARNAGAGYFGNAIVPEFYGRK